MHEDNLLHESNAAAHRVARAACIYVEMRRVYRGDARAYRLLVKAAKAYEEAEHRAQRQATA